MRHGQISKEQLLKNAEDIVVAEGLEALSIRRLAAESHVSVGTIYNYFAAKNDLVAAVVSRFWRAAVSGVIECYEEANFERFIAQLYARLHEHFLTFEHDWLGQLSALSQHDRQYGKHVEAQYFAYMRQRMVAVLLADEAVSEAVWTESLTPEALVGVIFEQMLVELRKGSENCGVLLAILHKLLYA